jgi:hypothetical protein
MMTVWSHQVDGYQVVSYTNISEEAKAELQKLPANRPYLKRLEDNGESLEIPFRPTGQTVPGPEGSQQPVLEVIPRSEWVDIQKAARDAEKALAKATRIADRKEARRAAAQALKDAKTGNFLGLDPKTDRIIITEVAATTIAQLSAGALTNEGEPA